MKKLIFLIPALVLAFSARGQALQQILQSVEQNNTTLYAAQEMASAKGLQASTGLTLENPEVEFGYLWGNTGVATNRVDVSIKQSFDFPSAYVYKTRIAKMERKQAQTEYRRLRLEILTTTSQAVIEMIYLNAMSAELKKRVENIRELATSYEKLLATGSANALEVNKAKMSLISIEGQLAQIESQRAQVANSLAALNGGAAIEVTQTQYDTVDLPDDFQVWVDNTTASNPALEYLISQTEIARENVKLSITSSLPSFAVGYKSEALIAGEQFQGVMASMSIPLWANKNGVKAAKATLLASQVATGDGVLQFLQRLKSDYDRAQSLKAIDQQYGQQSELTNSVELLKKSLEMGGVSLLEYLVQVESTYAFIDEAMTVSRDFQLAASALWIWSI